MWKKINIQSEILYKQCLKKNIFVTTAESCTGGMLASSIVSVSGSSNIFKSSVITYSNEMKSLILKIPSKIIEINGAVSEIVAKKMAINVLTLLKADVSISVTGIAGPGGGSEEKPVGLVWMAIATSKSVVVQKNFFHGNRLEIRQKTTLEALKLANKTIKKINS